LQQLEPVVVHLHKKFTLKRITSDRTDYGINAALGAKGCIAIVAITPEPPQGAVSPARLYSQLNRSTFLAADFKYCGKEVKRKLEQGPVDHETDFNVKVYANGRVTADAETLRALGDLSEREISEATRLSRRIIRRIRHEGQVKASTMKRITDFLAGQLRADGQDRAQEGRKPHASRRSLVSGHKVKTPVR